MPENKDGKSSINVKRLTMWKITKDDEKETTYDESPRVFPNQLNSAQYQPSMQTNAQYGDGVKVEDYVAKDGGTLNIVIRGFTDGDNEFLFGEKTQNKISVSNADDVVPDLCVAYATERPDGLLNLYKFPKVKFMPQGETANQREGSQVQYGTASIQGSYSPLLSNHDDVYKMYGVDPEADKEIIEKWFTTAEADTQASEAV